MLTIFSYRNDKTHVFTWSSTLSYKLIKKDVSVLNTKKCLKVCCNIFTDQYQRIIYRWKGLVKLSSTIPHMMTCDLGFTDELSLISDPWPQFLTPIIYTSLERSCQVEFNDSTRWDKLIDAKIIKTRQLVQRIRPFYIQT
jgi:hypothetical protein